MYQIFAMSQLGRVYALSTKGWVILNNPYIMSFYTLQDAREFLYESIVGATMDGTDYLDSYIGEIDSDGELVRTFPILPSKAENKG